MKALNESVNENRVVVIAKFENIKEDKKKSSVLLQTLPHVLKWSHEFKKNVTLVCPPVRLVSLL